MRGTAEYAERKAKYLQRKREYKKSLVDVAIFDANDEMTIKRMPRSMVEQLEQPFKLIDQDQQPLFKVGKEMSGPKFIDNLQKVNQQR